MPVRQEYEKLTAELTATQKDRQTLNAQMDAANHQFGAPDSHDPANSPVDVSALAITSSSSLPTFPRISVIYIFGLLAGAGGAYLLVVLLHRNDDTLHSSQEATAMLAVPIIGTVS